MKKAIILTTCIIAFSVQANTSDKIDKDWYQYKTIVLPDVKPSKLNTKLKLLELVSLRQWKVNNQTRNSFDMTLDKCHIKIEFSNENIIINHNGYKSSNNRYGSQYNRAKHNKNTICKSRWLSNTAKDVHTTLDILSLQQKAINLENQ